MPRSALQFPAMDSLAATPSPVKPTAKGFTLIEIMVVLVLIGVIASLAVLSLAGTEADPAKDTAQRLSATLQSLRQEALFRQKDYGVAITPDGYTILEWTGNDWTSPPAEDLNMRSQYTLPEGHGLELELLVDGRDGFEDPAQGGTSASLVPDLMLLSTGESTEFELALYHPASGSRWRIVGDVVGQIALHKDGPDPLP